MFVTTDLARALAHYERLGFAVEPYDNEYYYGYACRTGSRPTWPRLTSSITEPRPRAPTSGPMRPLPSTASGLQRVGGRLAPPEPTSYGLDEGAHVDPDGNLIRFGSPPVPPRACR